MSGRATAFVAGFIGVSNLLSGEAGKAVSGSNHTVTIRPEKISLSAPWRAWVLMMTHITRWRVWRHSLSGHV